MKILDGQEKYGEHVNFIDENDVFVGYSLSQGCCEAAGWFISEEIADPDTLLYNIPENPEEFDVEEYIFDQDFVEDVHNKHLDAGAVVVFRLVSKEGKPDLFLHLYNCHNGYYGHGFEVKHKGEIVKEDYL